jgi:hypothetical protein
MDWTGLGLGVALGAMTRAELAAMLATIKTNYDKALQMAAGNAARTAQIRTAADTVAAGLADPAIVTEATRTDVPTSDAVSVDVEKAVNALNIASYDLDTFTLQWEQGIEPAAPVSPPPGETAPLTYRRRAKGLPVWAWVGIGVAGAGVVGGGAFLVMGGKKRRR